MTRATRHRNRRLLWHWGMGCILAAALYYLFAGQLTGSETICAALAVAPAIAWAALIARVSEHRLQLAAPWRLLVRKVIRSVASDSLRVGRELLRAIGRRPGGPVGALVRQPFRMGAADDGADAAHRALAVLAISLAPNQYVVRLAPDQDLLLLHSLVRVAKRPDTEWPV